MHALDEDYITVAEAATLLRVAPSTVRRWIRQGDVPAYRIGQRRVALRHAGVANSSPLPWKIINQQRVERTCRLS